MPDRFDLERFVVAQHPVIAQVRRELGEGRKHTHWMWFVFPQLRGLGRSAAARHYGIGSLAEARAYLAHPVLGRRLVGLTLEAGGLRVDRAGEPWCIPAGDLRGIEVASHHAGKEVYADKVLVVDWQLGPATLRSGFVLDEVTAPGWADRLKPLVPR